MRFVILSRGPFLYSTQSLYSSARKRGHAVTIIDHTACGLQLLPEAEGEIWYEGNRLGDIDGIIPRIGPSVTGLGAAVIRQLEQAGAVSTISPEALLRVRDKFQTLQLLAARGLPVPRTALPGGVEDLAPLSESLGGFPLVLKLEGATHGSGVILQENLFQLRATFQAFQQLRQQVSLQEYIREASGQDLRVLVVGGEVVAAMERQAHEGDFRANLHLGGTGKTATLSKREIRTAIRAARLLGLEVAGVDLLRSSRGHLLLEVNASPGLEGIETVTGRSVADRIVRRLEELVREKRTPHADPHS